MNKNKNIKQIKAFMAGKLSLANGKKLVKLARKSIEYYCASGSQYRENPPDKKFKEKRGVFVTLNSYPGGELRGCIGLPYPIKGLWNAVAEAAVSAASRDPRFPPLCSKELEKATIEVSVLTEPEEVDTEKLPEAVEAGKHGIIIERESQSGLLLPQVAAEFGWNNETFLCQACAKAGVHKRAWALDDTTVKLFEAQIFKETMPGKKIIEEKN